MDLRTLRLYGEWSINTLFFVEYGVLRLLRVYLGTCGLIPLCHNAATHIHISCQRIPCRIIAGAQHLRGGHYAVKLWVLLLVSRYYYKRYIVLLKLMLAF